MEFGLELETISTEMIKPSKATPKHLKSYKLSLLDQIHPLLEYSTPTVFFYTKYEVGSYGSDTVTRLKDSLSKTLSLYYPLAGRLIINDSTINCNDEGVPLIVTRVNSTLSKLLASPNRVDLVPSFIPRDVTFLDPTRFETDGLIPMAFQISVFNCGGFSIGSQVINKFLDGLSWAYFYMTWAAIANGTRPPVVNSDLTVQTRVFPPVSVSDSDSCLSPAKVPVLQPITVGSGGCVVKTFEFSQASIGRLQAMARSDTVPNPTRVESITCFLWKHLMAAARVLQSSTSSIAGQEQVPTTSSAIHSVNMRPHLRPAVPQATFGKFVTHAFANWENKSGSVPEIRDLVILLRQVLSTTKDSNTVNKLRGEDRLEAARHHKKMLEEFIPKAYFFTSLSGFEQVNFGSGEPAWIGCTGGRLNSFFKNYIQLIHSRDRKIEVWIILDEHEMEILESDQEFLVFVRPSEPEFIYPLRASL